ncbi:hypothetical protein [Bacteroides fluxus]|uniref:hypothetical protein n=1 Tax=Bacteroides fluxus TaxID=626930 RepID=UPI002352B7F5|nr:hypothetical protein [Bacteroides fluxus]
MNLFVKKCSRLKIFDVLVVLSVLTCFTSAPYIGYYLFGHSYVLVSGGLSIGVFLLAYCYLDSHIDIWMKVVLVFMLSFIFYGCLMIIVTQELSDFRKGVGMAMKCIYVLGSCLIIRNKYEKYLNIFMKVNALIVLMSIILFLILLIGIQWPSTDFLKQDGRMHYLYFPLGATNARYLFGYFTFIRIAGFADEPGALALILTYLLVLNEFTFKSNKYRIIFFIGGILTFSMAFIITIIPILYYWFRIGLFKIKKFFVLGILLASLSIYFVIQNDDIYKGLDTLIFNRFEKDASGNYNGDNRSFAIPLQKQAFQSSPILGVGFSIDNVYKYNLGYPSFYSYLAMHGLFGYLFFYIPFLYIAVKYIKRNELLLLLAIALNYLQRPSIEEMFPLICFSLIFYSSNTTFKLKYDNGNNSIIK